MSLTRRLARPLLAASYLYGGIDWLRHPTAHAPSIAPLVHRVAPPLGLPDAPERTARAVGAVQVAAGVMLATGRLPRLAATVLALTSLPGVVGERPFWAEKDPQGRQGRLNETLTKAAGIGGLILAAVDTEGRPSLGWRAQRAGRSARRNGEEAYQAGRKRLNR